MEATEFTIAEYNDIKRMYDEGIGNQGWRGQAYNRVTAPIMPSALENLNKTLGMPKDIEAIVSVMSSRGLNHDHYYTWVEANKDYAPIKDRVISFKGLPMFVWIKPNFKDGLDISKFAPSAELLELAKTAKDPKIMGRRDVNNYYWDTHHNLCLQSSNVSISVEVGGVRVFMAMPFFFAEKVFGLEIAEDFKLTLSNGVTSNVAHQFHIIMETMNTSTWEKYQHIVINVFDYTLHSLDWFVTNFGMNVDNTNRILKGMLAKPWSITDPGKLEGIRKNWVRLLPIMEEVKNSDPIIFCSYRTLARNSGKSIEGVKISSIFNDIFDKVQDKESFIKALKNFFDNGGDQGLMQNRNTLESAIKRLDSYKQKRKGVLKGQAGRAFAKIQEEAENLTIDKVKYKRTWAQIEAGNIGIGTFFRKSEQYFLLNDNWELWEEMFKRGFGEQAIELANEVKGRSTYEKDLMSYFYFVLYALPEYLKKQTGHKWKCIPRLVNSSEELEPPKEGTDGVARTRSALTPHVDNEKHTVTVPYASLAISGYRSTTYCYSHDYHVLTRGMSMGGYVVTKDVEEKLNGRDDYGLMFYTLTGSVQGRGYPSFLIIFERRERFEDTRVHFHRTHPFRSKDGDYNPLHQWVRGCYNWMAGNIKTDRIKAQQGDLFFVQVKTDAAQELDGPVVKDLDFSYKVNQYDKHCFEREVAFAENTKAAKNNILGYVKLDEDIWLKHTEHDNVLIPSGTYAIHQCRSWEANPKGVWSLRID